MRAKLIPGQPSVGLKEAHRAAVSVLETTPAKRRAGEVGRGAGRQGEARRTRQEGSPYRFPIGLASPPGSEIPWRGARGGSGGGGDSARRGARGCDPVTPPPPPPLTLGPVRGRASERSKTKQTSAGFLLCNSLLSKSGAERVLRFGSPGGGTCARCCPAWPEPVVPGEPRQGSQSPPTLAPSPLRASVLILWFPFASRLPNTSNKSEGANAEPETLPQSFSRQVPN